MKKSERIRRVLDGEPVDRIPFALWRHTPPEDSTPEGLVALTVRFTRRWDFDFVKAMFPNWFFTIDWGNKFGPYDRFEGHLPVTERVIKDVSDWKKLKALDPMKGALGNQVKALRMMREELGPDIPIVATMFAPLTVAFYLAGEVAYEHVATNPKEMHAALKVITQTYADFAQACVEAGADGLFYAVHSATHDAISPDAYNEFALPYDLEIFDRIGSRTWFNMLHLCRPNLRFEVANDYPVQAVNWYDRGPTGPTLTEARKIYPGILIGGLGQQTGGALISGVPEEAAAEARDAIEQTGGKKLMLGPGCAMFLAAPEANIDAVSVVASHPQG
jgi:uroporphyrinogen decarboxylase